MNEPQNAVVARLSAEFAALSQQLARMSADLVELDRILTARAAWPQYAPPPWPASPPPPWPTPPPSAPAPPPSAPAPARQRSEGWIAKLLAVAGVAVTLIGVVLLLVLAAQAGILRPEFRVTAGALLAAALVGAAGWLDSRPGGRTGAIALAATGVTAAYIDVTAVTTIYHWIPSAAALVVASVIACGGLTLARRWNSEHLGLLVLVPLVGLAPMVTDGFTLVLVGFMLALSAVSLPVQLGKDWIWLHAARIGVATVPLLLALVASYIRSREDLLLAGACGVAALLALTAALILLPRSANRAAMAVLTVVGVAPVVCVTLAVDRVVAALMAATLAAALLAIALAGDRLPGVSGIVRQIFSATSAVATLIAVTVAFAGPLAGPLLLAFAVVVAVAGRRDPLARWSAIGFALAGVALHAICAPPDGLLDATQTDTATGISTLVSSLLLIAAAIAITRSHGGATRMSWGVAAAVVVYAVTSLTVTAGVLIAGPDRGFHAGHMVATICWIAMAAAVFGYAVGLPRADRSIPIGGGLGLVGAAVTKLFLFDLGTLDGIFRVAVFIVVGLALLTMGAGYARWLDRQDRHCSPTSADRLVGGPETSAGLVTSENSTV